MGTIALLERILSVVSSLLGLTPLLELVGIGLDKAAHEHVEFAIESAAVATSLAVANPTTGLAAIHADIAAAQAAIIAALDGLVVSLPDEPPVWYTAPPAVGDVGAAVWGYQFPDYNLAPASYHIQQLSQLRSQLQYGVAFTFREDPFLVLQATWGFIPD